jgi:hypothetical protein
MGFRIEEYEELRPYLYHLTAASNAERIVRTGALQPALALLEQAGLGELRRTRRAKSHVLSIDGAAVVIRDQIPLIEANIEFEDGWQLPELVEFLNTRVFVWPGDNRGPIDYGQRHYDRYSGEPLRVFRFQVRSVLAANVGARLLFSRYNSGAARQNQGQRIPRGPRTFLPAGRFSGTCGQVKEAAFDSAIVLPSDTEVGTGTNGPWRATFQSGAV